MKQKFIVGISSAEFANGEFRVVSATSEEEALLKFAKVYGIHEKVFKENVYLRTVNMSFAEKFWSREDFKYFAGEGDEEYEPDEEEFKARVREFFGEHQDFAEIYIDYYFNEDIPVEGSPEHTFSEEMLLCIWLKDEADEVAVFDLLNMRL